VRIAQVMTREVFWARDVTLVTHYLTGLTRDVPWPDRSLALARISSRRALRAPGLGLLPQTRAATTDLVYMAALNSSVRPETDLECALRLT